MNSAIPAAVVSANRRKMINAFRRMQATTPQNARSLKELGLRQSILFNIQKARGVIVETEPGRFYLDEAREAETRHVRRILFAIVLFLSLAYLTYFYWGNL